MFGGLVVCLARLAAIGLMIVGLGAIEARAEKRLALVIGNSAYAHTSVLANTLHDAKDVAAALERTGFEVIVATDADKRRMDGALRAFAEKLSEAEVALFFYAGHGLQVGNENFLVPVDARLGSQRDLEFEAVKLNFVLRQMEIDREGKTTIVMLDACRDNPLSRSLARSMGTRSTAVGSGLAPAATGVGTFIAYATQPGNVALDGDGRNSPFTTALLANMERRGRNLNATMIDVRKAVISSTGGKQVPWDHSALTGDFYFVPGTVPAGSQTTAPRGDNEDVAAMKARLKALEDAEKKRQAGAEPARAGVRLMPPEVLNRIAEQRARLAVAEDKAKDLQRRLLEARRFEGQARTPEERQSRLQDSIRIQREMTEAALRATRLRGEIAALTSPPPPAPPAAATPTPLAVDLAPSRKERGFDIYDQAAVAGDAIKVSGADSLAGCLNTCRNTAGCIAGAYQPSAPPRASCSVYRKVVRLNRDTTGGAAFVKPASLGQATCKPLGIAFAEDIPLSPGMALCNGIGQHEVRVERITETAVAFTSETGDFTCRPGDLCQFAWPGAPLFTIRISGGAGAPADATLTPTRR
jgi:uncharacterized caspase-like protein